METCSEARVALNKVDMLGHAIAKCLIKHTAILLHKKQFLSHKYETKAKQSQKWKTLQSIEEDRNWNKRKWTPAQRRWRWKNGTKVLSHSFEHEETKKNENKNRFVLLRAHQNPFSFFVQAVVVVSACCYWVCTRTRPLSQLWRVCHIHVNIMECYIINYNYNFFSLVS